MSTATIEMMAEITPDVMPAQTSVPDFLMTYCRQLADVHYGRKLNRMYIHLLQGFLAYKPWKADPPFPWRVARIHGSSGPRLRKGADLGWVPMNMVLPIALFEKIKTEIDHINASGEAGERVLSLRTFLYTAISWWCTAVHEYQGPGMIPD